MDRERPPLVVSRIHAIAAPVSSSDEPRDQVTTDSISDHTFHRSPLHAETACDKIMRMDRAARRALVRIKVLVGKGFYRYTESARVGRIEHGIADDDVRDIVEAATSIVRQSENVWRIVGVDISDRRIRLVIELLQSEAALISVHLFERIEK